jgi:uncharacterized membrane protein
MGLLVNFVGFFVELFGFHEWKKLNVFSKKDLTKSFLLLSGIAFLIALVFIFLWVESSNNISGSALLIAVSIRILIASFVILTIASFLCGSSIKKIIAEHEKYNLEKENERQLKEQLLRKQEREKQERNQAEINRQLAEKRAKEEARRQELQDIEDRESAKSRGQAQGMIMLYQEQMRLLVEHKRQGLDIERETYTMREKLLKLEREENNGMVQDLLRTLDSL